jgi:hypothetical protein
MTLRINCLDETAPYPRPLRLTLRCDSDHGLFPVEASFERHEDGFIGLYRMAMDAGWKDTSASGVRMFFGPCCSHKATRQAEGE